MLATSKERRVFSILNEVMKNPSVWFMVFESVLYSKHGSLNVMLMVFCPVYLLPQLLCAIFIFLNHKILTLITTIFSLSLRYIYHLAERFIFNDQIYCASQFIVLVSQKFKFTRNQIQVQRWSLRKLDKNEFLHLLTST